MTEALSGDILFRSNFVLSQIRSLFPGFHERYVKWYVVGAINGAVLGRGPGSIQVLFMPPDWSGDVSANQAICRLPSFVTTLSATNIALPQDLCGILESADNEAASIVVKRPAVVTEIARLQISGALSSTPPSVDDIIKLLATALDGTPVFDEPPFQDDGNVLFDAEIILKTPVAEGLACEKLRPIFPSVRNLLGIGLLTNSREGGSDLLNRLTWGRLIARQA